jgi:hypothetical protein
MADWTKQIEMLPFSVRVCEVAIVDRNVLVILLSGWPHRGTHARVTNPSSEIDIFWHRYRICSFLYFITFEHI